MDSPSSFTQSANHSPSSWVDSSLSQAAAIASQGLRPIMATSAPIPSCLISRYITLCKDEFGLCPAHYRRGGIRARRFEYSMSTAVGSHKPVQPLSGAYLPDVYHIHSDFLFSCQVPVQTITNSSGWNSGLEGSRHAIRYVAVSNSNSVFQMALNSNVVNC